MLRWCSFSFTLFTFKVRCDKARGPALKDCTSTRHSAWWWQSTSPRATVIMPSPDSCVPTPKSEMSAMNVIECAHTRRAMCIVLTSEKDGHYQYASISIHWTLTPNIIALYYAKYERLFWLPRWDITFPTLENCSGSRYRKSTNDDRAETAFASPYGHFGSFASHLDYIDIGDVSTWHFYHVITGEVPFCTAISRKYRHFLLRTGTTHHPL